MGYAILRRQRSWVRIPPSAPLFFLALEATASPQSSLLSCQTPRPLWCGIDTWPEHEIPETHLWTVNNEDVAIFQRANSPADRLVRYQGVVQEQREQTGRKQGNARGRYFGGLKNCGFEAKRWEIGALSIGAARRARRLH